MIALVISVVQSKQLLRWCGLAATSYYLCLDVLEGEAWIDNYKPFHNKMVYALLLITAVATFFQSHRKKTEEAENIEARSLLAEFIEAVGSIVDAKLRRFREKAVSLKTGADKFGSITHPDDQIARICQASVSFVRKAYGLQDHEIDITIIRKRSTAQSWTYIYKHQSWSRGTPNDMMKNSNAAGKNCIKTGRWVFHPDKVLASLAANYVMSQRDKERGDGSVFLYPVVIPGETEETQFVIFMVTYSKKLCDEDDINAKSATESFLREICRRIELELCLSVIKSI